MSKLDKYLRFLPKEYKPAVNPVLNALLRAWAGADDEIMQQLQNTKAQLFVRTAEGTYLDKLASNFGVVRPFSLGLLDADFQELIPNLSLKQKQVTKSFYDTMDVFWGPEFSRANITATVNEPYAINVGDTFELRIDNKEIQRITVAPGDARIPGGVTSVEIARILNRLEDLTVSIVEDPLTGDTRINIRTDTPGPRGSIELISGFDVFGMIQDVRFRVTDLEQRTVLYQVNAGEIIIELPAIVPTLRRTLKGSHHFHSTSAIEPTIPPATKPWQGSFFYSTLEDPFVATSIKTELLEPIAANSTTTEITVNDSSSFPASGGKLIFDFGKKTEEQPVNYITTPNNNTILIDPGYTFEFTHEVGSRVNLLMPGITTPYKPRVDGSDLAIYFVSPASAREVVQEILKTLTAAGIVVTFVILLPSYVYIRDNPYDV